MGLLAGATYSIKRIFVSLAGKGLGSMAMACTNGLSVKMALTTSREGRGRAGAGGRAKKLEEERSSFVLPLKVRGVFGRLGQGQGHYLASPKERKEENNFRRLNGPNFPFHSTSSSSSRSLARQGSCGAAKSALCLSWTDRLLRLLAWHGRSQMMHADGPNANIIVLSLSLSLSLSASALLNLLANSIALNLSLAPCQY